MLGFVLLSFCVVFSNAQSSINANTTYGVLQGLSFDSHSVWRGVPFAKPPIGPLRFKSPVDIDPWTGIREAKTFQSGCMQSCVLPPHICPKTTSEDCLYIDIFTPSVAAMSDQKPRPVMVFIPGGAFFQGAGNVILYRGEFIANATDVILVDLSYRLGVFGSLVYEEHGKLASAGNFNLEDQRMVLRWVQKNIAAFGGDPQQVTLFGQSAGAMSASIHLISPLSRGLFHRVIMESNPFALPYKKQHYQRHWGNSFAKHLGCTSFSCMQSKTAAEVLKAQDATFYLSLKDLWDLALLWTPTIDGTNMPMAPLDAFKAGLAMDIPVLIGTVQNEGLIFVEEVTHFMNTAEYLAIMTALFGPITTLTIDQFYPANSVPTANKTMVASHVVTDYVFRCSTRRATRLLAQHNANIWLYRFDHPLSFGKAGWGPRYAYCEDVTCHGGELPFVFDAATLANVTYTPDEVVLSKEMQTYWTNFAKSGTPNGPVPVGTTWPKTISGSHSVNLLLQTPQLSTNTDYESEVCDKLWDALYP